MQGFEVTVGFDERRNEWVARIVSGNKFEGFGDTASEALMDVASQYCLFCEEQEIDNSEDDDDC